MYEIKENKDRNGCSAVQMDRKEFKGKTRTRLLRAISHTFILFYFFMIDHFERGTRVAVSRGPRKF